MERGGAYGKAGQVLQLNSNALTYVWVLAAGGTGLAITSYSLQLQTCRLVGPHPILLVTCFLGWIFVEETTQGREG